MINDLRYSVRWLRRSPGFTAVAVLSLGLGIGVNTAMFSLVDAVLLRPLPVNDSGSLVDVFTSGGDGDDYATTSYPDFLDLQAQNTVFAALTAYTPMFAPLNLGDRARLVLGQLVLANHFDMLGIRPALGRMLQPQDDRPGASPVVVISHRLWQSDFGGDPGIIGRPLELRGLRYTIVGVAPAEYTGVIPLIVPELWLPLVHAEEVEPAGINDSIPSPTGRSRLERRGTRWLFVKGRLKPGLDAAAAHANVALIGGQLADAYPQTNRGRRMAAVATDDVRLLVPQATGPIALGSAGVMSVVGLVLLIACANVTGLLLARASARRREIALRLAVGASRRQLIRQMLAEGLVLGAAGALIAVALAWGLIRVLAAIQLPLPGDFALDLRLDLRVLSFAAAIAAMAGLLTSLVPAFKSSSPHLVGDLRGAQPVVRVGGGRWALRDALVIGQIALTAVLLVVAGLLLRTLAAASSADVGFRIEGLALLSTDTGMVRYDGDRASRFWTEAIERIRALPGVESVALATPRLPFDLNFTQTNILVDDKAYGPDDRGETVANVAVSPEYFETLGIPVVEGRVFDPTDREDAPLVAVVNETMARRFWPGRSAVGRTFTLAHRTGQYQIIGVIADHRVHAVAERPTPYLHFAAAQRPAGYNYLVARTAGSATALLAAMRRELLAIEPGLVFVNSATMETTLARTLLPARVGALLALAFGGLGTLLAAVGLYGVIAFSVARRTREIAVRVAVGADARRVFALVASQGLGLAAMGAGTGLVLAAVAARLLQGALYGVGLFDPVAWGAALAVLVLAAALANLVPVRRAMRVEPATALRSE